MENKEAVRVLGGNKPRAKWDRFNRVQRNAEVLTRVYEPKGVYRFKTWEEFNAWKMKYQVRAESPPKATS